ncbi:ATP-dependent DNA helicase [Streptomyces sp. NPDC047022]|uniref:HelD family protein n=1 Tax=Streptomyces sp. NPDC047022 TaxID=3155737 RepID=UPI0033DC0B3B
MPQVDGGDGRQVAVEQARVRAVYELLDERLEQARAQLAAVLRLPVEGSGEAYAREVEAGRLTSSVRRLEGAEQGLVFGRIDGVDGTALYVGRIGLRRQDDDVPLLVDWRAQAARPFYAATPLHPLGLRRRRHLRCEGREVCAVSDEILDGSAVTAQDVVGDGPLVRALEAGRTGRMGAVVATLQAEQDAVVRSEDRGVTVVQGGPGTGKTVVALHRAAYLLYAAPRVAERGVLVLGPNTRLLDHISQVLPSLGESDAVLATCQDLAGVRQALQEPFETARLKGRLVMADALAGLVRSRQALGGDFTVRVGQEQVRLPDEEIARARDAAAGSGLPHNRAREVFKRHLVEATTRALQDGFTTTLARFDAEAAASTGIDLDRAVEDDLRTLGLDDTPTADAGGEFDADAVRAALLDDARTEHAVQALWPHLKPEALVRELLAGADALAAHLPDLARADRSRLLHVPGTGWTDADAALLDEAAYVLDGLPERTFGHVVVDEAQELTPMQWRMVLRRCPSRSMTVVGDFAQAGPAVTARDWQHTLAPHLGKRFILHTLTVNYRTTKEILARASGLLAQIAPDQTPSRSIRHGETPRTLTVTARSQLAAALADELRTQADAYPGDLRAVLCPDATTAELTDTRITRWARLVPASQARGLEFDSVIVALPDEIAVARPSGGRDLYVALTRATKRLCVITTEPA